MAAALSPAQAVTLGRRTARLALEAPLPEAAHSS